MLHMGKQTRRRPEEVIQNAVAFFGPRGTGLEIKQQTKQMAWFEGGGGHVLVRADAKEDGSDVDIETREWEYQVKQFISKL